MAIKINKQKNIQSMNKPLSCENKTISLLNCVNTCTDGINVKYRKDIGCYFITGKIYEKLLVIRWKKSDKDKVDINDNGKTMKTHLYLLIFNLVL